jgi:DNA polymerase I-like protein with 3'-5' exonuclease and polymerase domains
LGKTRGGVQRLLEDLEEDSLREIEHVPVIALLQEKSKLSKQISTYGYNWTKEWASTGDYRDGPGKESGWLSPIDHRLHCNFNQLYAETGRSSSSRPNAQNIPRLTEMRSCFIVSDPDENAPEGYVMVTADMSGAELRILAELSGEPRWIEAFNRGEDVHDVCIETIDPDFWYSLPRLDNCDYFALKPDGEMQRKKCKCPSHNDARSAWKPTNFGLPYGIGPSSLTVQINKEVKVKKTIDDVREMMAMHQAAFPTTWKYLAMQSAIATALMKATDMFDRRRLFTVPEIDEATRRAHRRSEKELRLADDVCEENMKALKSICAAETPPRKPTKDEKWVATHRPLTEAEERASMDEMQGNIARQGKNHPIQGTNASIAKVAMGAGFDRDGSPYLWHTLPLWGARLIKFVHDELVVECPARYGQQVADLIGDAFKRAAAEVMRKVVMTFDYHINTYWEK